MQRSRDEEVRSPSSQWTRLSSGDINMAGLVGLIVGLLGLTFASLGSPIYVGGLLLLAGLILGIVGVTLATKEKVSSITAVSASIVGSIVAAFMFGTAQTGQSSAPDTLPVAGELLNDTYGSSDFLPGASEGLGSSTVSEPGVQAPRDDGPTGNSVGSRENPASIGETVSLTGWEFVVNRFDRNGTAEVLAANRLNDPPASGSQWTILNVTVTYTGTGSSHTYGIAPKFVTHAGNVIDGGKNYAVPPAPRFLGQEVYSGASVSGHLVYEIPEQTQGLLRLNGDGLSEKAFVNVG